MAMAAQSEKKTQNDLTPGGVNTIILIVGNKDWNSMRLRGGRPQSV